jgi:hypothetical protein
MHAPECHLTRTASLDGLGTLDWVCDVRRVM